MMLDRSRSQHKCAYMGFAGPTNKNNDSCGREKLVLDWPIQDLSKERVTQADLASSEITLSRRECIPIISSVCLLLATGGASVSYIACNYGRCHKIFIYDLHE
jgi:hypothetical protein